MYLSIPEPLMAYRNKKDVYHSEADDLLRRALQREFGSMYTTDFIYDETLTLANGAHWK